MLLVYIVFFSYHKRVMYIIILYTVCCSVVLYEPVGWVLHARMTYTRGTCWGIRYYLVYGRFGCWLGSLCSESEYFLRTRLRRVSGRLADTGHPCDPSVVWIRFNLFSCVRRTCVYVYVRFLVSISVRGT